MQKDGRASNQSSQPRLINSTLINFSDYSLLTLWGIIHNYIGLNLHVLLPRFLVFKRPFKKMSRFTNFPFLFSGMLNIKTHVCTVLINLKLGRVI